MFSNKIYRAMTVVLAALLMVSALALCACTGSGGEAGGKTKTAIEPGAPFKDDRDMALMIDGKTYPVRVDSKDVLAALDSTHDSDCAYEETVSCVYKGYDKSFDYGDIRVSTVPVDEVDIIEMFTITSGDYATPRGIKVGASRQDVLTAYGENFTSDDGYYITYTANGDPADYSAMRVMFKMNGDTVEEICIYSPSYTND